MGKSHKMSKKGKEKGNIMLEIWKWETGLLLLCVYVLCFIQYFLFIVLANSTHRWGKTNWKLMIQNKRLTPNQQWRKSEFDLYLIPAVAAATGGWQPGSSIFRPQTPPQLCRNPEHTESEQHEHQTESQLQHCPNSYAATHLLGGLLTAGRNSEAKTNFQLLFCSEISTDLALEKSWNRAAVVVVCHQGTPPV